MAHIGPNVTTANPEDRVLDHLIDFFAAYGYAAVFAVLLLCGFGLPIPEDITLVSGGFIASLTCSAEAPFPEILGSCHEVHVMFAVSMLGVLMGDSVMYLLGRAFGDRILRVRFFAKLVTPKRYAWVQDKFLRYGVLLVFAARFMPGLRAAVFVVAGISRKISYAKFLATDGLAALISVPIWVYLGFWGHQQLSDLSVLEDYVKKSQLGVIIILILAIAGIVSIYFIKKKLCSKGLSE